MKKRFFLIFLALAAYGTTFSQDDFSLKIKAKSSELSLGKLYLIYQYKYSRKVDSAVLTAGQTRFTGKIDGPTPARLYFLPEGTPFGGDFNKLAARDFYLEKGKNDFFVKEAIEDGIVKQSKLNREFRKYQSYLEEINEEVSKARSATSYNLQQRKANDKRYQTVMEEQRNKLYEFVANNSKSYFSIVALNEIITSKMDMDRIENAFQTLDKKVRKQANGVALAEFIEREQRTKVGTIAMEFTQNDVNGKPVNLSDFRGKYVLIDFWASWCGPCRVENPHLVKAYNKYKDKNFTILGISLDNPGQKQAWLDAVEADGLVWTQLSDLQGWKNEVAVMYGIKGVPASFLINPEGIIVAKRLRGNEVIKKLEELLD